MKQYSHDYTKPSEVESLLYSATRLMANECYDAAVERINEARQLLQEYLAQDNMVKDDDVADGWVKASDAFDDDQLCFIRDEFACIMEQSDNKNDELDIINKCCRHLDDPEYESFKEFQESISGTWAEKRGD